MKRIALPSLIFVGIVIFTACGNPSPVAPPTPLPQPTAQPSKPTSTPTELAATKAPPTEAPTQARDSSQVLVTLADNTINSTLTTFKAGEAYTFVISNHGRHEHNFVISPPVATAGSYTDAFAQALLVVDETQLPPGSTVTVDFTFPATAAGADLEFNCLIRRHYESGMRLPITVAG